MPHASSSPRSHPRRHRCHPSASAAQSSLPPKASSWLPSQSQSPLGMSDIHTRSSPGPLQMPQASSAPRVVHVVTDAIGIPPLRSRHHTRPRRRAGCRQGRSRPWGCLNIHTRRWRQAAADPATSRRQPASTSSQMPSASASASQSPPNAQGVELLPSQSQSPAGMSEHPHS